MRDYHWSARREKLKTCASCERNDPRIDPIELQIFQDCFPFVAIYVLDCTRRPSIDRGGKLIHWRVMKSKFMLLFDFDDVWGGKICIKACKRMFNILFYSSIFWWNNCSQLASSLVRYMRSTRWPSMAIEAVSGFVVENFFSQNSFNVTQLSH